MFYVKLQVVNALYLNRQIKSNYDKIMLLNHDTINLYIEPNSNDAGYSQLLKEKILFICLFQSQLCQKDYERKRYKNE